SGDNLTLFFSTEISAKAGDVIKLSIKPGKIHIFDNETSLRLN
ncbi:MAG: sugar ABC transporter ATP-binding protein, partial [Spirochaetes bacterium]